MVDFNRICALKVCNCNYWSEVDLFDHSLNNQKEVDINLTG